MNYPKTTDEAFKELVNKANDMGDGYMAPNKRNLLEHLADENGIVYDAKPGEERLIIPGKEWDWTPTKEELENITF